MSKCVYDADQSLINAPHILHEVFSRICSDLLYFVLKVLVCKIPKIVMPDIFA